MSRAAIALGAGALVIASMASCVGGDPEPVAAPPGADGGGDASTNGDASTGSDASDASVADGGCPIGTTDCPGASCVDLATSADHCGACDKSCGAGKCKSGQCSARIAFVTKEKFTGALGGVTGADAKCQQAATNAKLRGRYKAWISLGGTQAKDRLEKSSVPYELVDGTMLAVNWSDLTDKSLIVPLNRTEENVLLIPGELAFTQTLSDGATNTPVENACTGWTAGAGAPVAHRPGRPESIDNSWTELAPVDCGVMAHLYCFEQP